MLQKLLKKLGRPTKRREIIWAIQKASRQQIALHLLLSLPDRVVRFNYRGREVAFFVPDAYLDQIQQQLLVDRNFYEHRALEWVRDRIDLAGASVADIGANIGNHSVFFTNICGAAHCLSFEPLPHTFDILERNAALNGDRIEARRLALSDRATTISVVDFDLANVGATHFREGGPDGFRAVPLDSLELTKLDFAKIDVEGMAAKVLAGARETLSQFKPPLMIEIDKTEEVECEAELRLHGYARGQSFGWSTYFYEARR